MVEEPQFLALIAVLRTVNELQSPGDINYRIRHSETCRFTLFQGRFFFLAREEKGTRAENKVIYFWANIHR